MDDSAAGAEVDAKVARVLEDWVTQAKAGLGEQLVSVVLFGSAAEGRLRATSDVNLVMVLKRFDAERLNGLRETLRVAHAAVQLEVMFLLEHELSAASEAFAVKFADILLRRRVLFGPDPFVGLKLSPSAELARLKQMLLNLSLRLRLRYMLSSLREEQAARVVADSAGPLRACAEALLELRGSPAEKPKQALERYVAALGDAKVADLPRLLSLAREQQALPVGTAAATLLSVLELSERLRADAERVRLPS